MAIPWPLTVFSSTRLLFTTPTIRTIASPYTSSPSNHLSNRTFTFHLALPNKSHPFITTSTKPHDRRLKIIAVHFNISFQPLISPHYHWGIWTSLFTAGAFDLWPEKTKVRSALSGALVSTLVALTTTNLNIIASEVPVYYVVLEYLLLVAVHLLLFKADLRHILQSPPVLLLAFLLGLGYGGLVGSSN